VGGLAVGETHEEMYRILDGTVPHLPQDKPVYLMGVGTPLNIVEGVWRGVDFFDCVYPSRNGRHGHAYTHHGKINLNNAKFTFDETPIEETIGALYDIVKSGKALYAGISNYNPAQTERAVACMKEMGMHMLIHQPNYSMFNRSIEHGLTDVAAREGVGIMAFGPLAGGKLTGRYLNGIPADSRAVHDPRFLRASDINESLLKTVRALNAVAEDRGQTLAQLALVWTLRNPVVTSALIGASRPEQVIENVKALENMNLSPEEIAKIDAILATEK
jgi:aryl-alcohol dehydrogenase-like predicted oxidoreductase